jgi:hypothetical protein
VHGAVDDADLAGSAGFGFAGTETVMNPLAGLVADFFFFLLGAIISY